MDRAAMSHASPRCISGSTWIFRRLPQFKPTTEAHGKLPELPRLPKSPELKNQAAIYISGLRVSSCSLCLGFDFQLAILAISSRVSMVGFTRIPAIYWDSERTAG